MKDTSRIKIAAVVTTLSIGGLTALGIAVRRDDSVAKAPSSSTVPTAAAPAFTQAVGASQPVRTNLAPGEGEEHEYESEGAEHEEYDEYE